MTVKAMLTLSRGIEYRDVDYVEALTAKTVDIVSRIYDGGHNRWCEFIPSITANGLVYCDACLCQISCIHPKCEEI